MNPSLLLIPDRYKASKLYSQIPDSGAGDLAFTRALDTATRVNSAGLIEKVRTNVCLYSEQVDNAWWGKARVTITANATTNPIDGASTADKMVADSTPSVSHDIGSSAITVTGSIIYVVSAYFKKAEYDFAVLGGSAAAEKAWFNLNTGVKGSQGGSVLAYDMVDAGNGWYRCFVAILTTSGSFSVEATIANVDGSRVISGVASGGIFCFGFQLESGDVMTPYIPTTTAAVSVGPVANIPRIDYTGGGCGKLLLEPQRTNLFEYSEQFNNAYWSKVGATITANTTISPDGNINADTITGAGRIEKNIAATGAMTFSVFAKAGTSNEIRLNVFDGSTDRGSSFNLSTGVAFDTYGSPAVSVVNYGNGWYRLIMTTTNAGTSNCQIHMDTATTAFIWGAQLEAGSYVSSYIPTLGASVTRSADSASKTGISSLIGQTAGTIYVEGSIIGKDIVKSNLFAALENTSSGATMRIFYSPATNTILGQVFNGSTFSADMSGGAIAVGQTFKVALAYQEDDFALAVNGVIVATDTSGVVPTTDDFKINTSIYNNLDAGVNSKATALYTTRLTNSELASLTTL